MVSLCRGLLLMALVMSDSPCRLFLYRYVARLLVLLLIESVQPVQCFILLLVCVPQLRSLYSFRRADYGVWVLSKLRLVFPFCESDFLLQIDKRTLYCSLLFQNWLVAPILANEQNFVADILHLPPFAIFKSSLIHGFIVKFSLVMIDKSPQDCSLQSLTIVLFSKRVFHLLPELALGKQLQSV